MKALHLGNAFLFFCLLHSRVSSTSKYHSSGTTSASQIKHQVMNLSYCIGVTTPTLHLSCYGPWWQAAFSLV